MTVTAPFQPASKLTASGLLKEEIAVRTEIGVLGQRLREIEQKKAAMTPLPEDKKEWVKEADSWTTVSTTPPGKIRVVVRMGTVSRRYWLDPRISTFGGLRYRFARELRCEGGPGALILRFDGMVLKDDQTPADVDMEDGDIIDCDLDPNAIVWSG